MILLALLLLAVAAALVVVAVMSGGDSVALSAFDVDVDTPVWGVFAAGVGTGVLALLGILALAAGVRRSRERREEIEYLRQKVAEHERTSGEDSPQDVGGWLAQAHGHDRPDAPQGQAPSVAQAQEPRHGQPGPGVAPLYRTTQG